FSAISDYIRVFFSFFLYTSRHNLYLHSFPTRRSSDLVFYDAIEFSPERWRYGFQNPVQGLRFQLHRTSYLQSDSDYTAKPPPDRSEEHTSELQSRFDLVCRLLLEKKKKLLIRVAVEGR